MTNVIVIQSFDVKPELYSGLPGRRGNVKLKNEKSDLEILVPVLHPEIHEKLVRWLAEQQQVTKDAIRSFLQEMSPPEKPEA